MCSRTRIRLALVIAFAVVAAITIQVQRAGADAPFGIKDDVWKGPAGDPWNTLADWYDILSNTNLVPQNAVNIGRRAIIGTDYPSPNGALAGSAVISAALPAAKAQIAGLAFGVRQRDFTVVATDPTFFRNPAPAAGALTGSLLITSTGTGTQALTCGPDVADATNAANGANGSILVGVDGRGYLTMTGGILNGTALTVAGENVTTGLGTSLLDLSGTAKVNIGPGSSGVSDFTRRVSITGPSVQFNTSGQLRLEASNTLTANITSATAHSPLVTANNAIVSGALNVNFSGAAATRDPIASLGQAWDLVTSTFSSNAIAGNFSNLFPFGDVAVTGLDAAHSAPVGGVYRLRKTSTATTNTLQLVYDKVLILTVNRDTGQLSVRNPYGGAIKIDGYGINSALGSMVTSYAGLGTSTPGAGTWSKPVDAMSVPLNTVNVLTEVKDPDFTPPNVNNDAYDLTSVPTVALGNGFNRLAVAGNIVNFGTSGEDLTFDYTSPNGGVVRGAVEYVGTKFNNNLVLRVNPTTGQAFIKNDSQVTLKFDGYSVLSSTAALNGAGFTGLGGTWQSSPATTSALTQTNLTNSLTLAPGAQSAIGTIGSFATTAAQNGLSLQFILSSNLPLPGDYNNNGAVDAADYTVWRDHLGQTFQLPNEGVGQTPGTVTTVDYDLWKANFGMNSTLTFRNGSIFFDPTAGAGAGSIAAVPEPSTFGLLLMGLGAALVVRRARSVNRQLPNSTPVIRSDSGQRGDNMLRRFGFCIAAAAAMLTAAPPSVMAQGIPLTNGDFELPGPAGTKVIAFDATGVPIPGIIPGWTFPGPGVETFGHAAQIGDSGTEGNGAGLPGNELLLSTFDGTVSQTFATNVANIPATQKYRLSFESRGIFTVFGPDTALSQYPPPLFPLLTSPSQITARLYYGAGKTTLLSLPFNVTGSKVIYNLDIPGGSPLLTPASLGQPLGVEFDTTSYENSVSIHNLNANSPVLTHGWAGVDNVLLQIAPVLAGDLNVDGVLSPADYDILRSNLQKTDPNITSYIANGELTGDGLINLNDFRALKNLFGGGSGSGALAGGSVPEPSTLVLTLIMAAAVSGSFIRRQASAIKRMRALLWSALAIGAALATASPSSAAVLYYDPFNIGANPAAGEYTLGYVDPPGAVPGPGLGDPANGQNPTVGPTPFFSGPWQIRTSDGNGPNNKVVSTGLSYLGSPASGGSIQPVVFTNPDTSTTADARVGRYLTTPWDATTSGTFYLSFLASFGVTNNPNGTDTGNLGFRTVEFWPTSGQGVGDDGGRSEIGYNGFFNTLGTSQQVAATAKLDFITPGGGTQLLTSTTFNLDNGATHLVVMKFVLSATAASDSISVFLDPTDSTEPIIPTVVASNLDYTLKAMGTMSFFGTPPGNVAPTGTLPAFDELRVATTYAEALPVFPTPGDTNGDLHVDMTDYLAILHHMNLTGQSAANGDVSGDGKVTIADYRIWKDHRTDLGPGAGAGAGIGVPEPASWILAFAAAVPACFLIRKSW